MAVLYVICGLVLVSFSIAVLHFSALGTYLINRRFAQVKRDIPYVPGSADPKQGLDVYLPKHAVAAGANFPIVHFIHGGYWVSGDKKYHQWMYGLYANIGCSLARRGIGVVISNYRLAPGTAVAGQLSDVTAAVDYSLAHATIWGGDGRVFVMGHSAGGQLISLLAGMARRPLLAGYIALSPILDVPAMIGSKSDSFNRRVSYPTFSTASDVWTEYSPLQQFERHSAELAKVIVLNGAKDFPYLKQQTHDAQAELAANGQQLRTVELPGLNHMAMVTGFGKSSNRLLEAVVAFINKPV